MNLLLDWLDRRDSLTDHVSMNCSRPGEWPLAQERHLCVQGMSAQQWHIFQIDAYLRDLCALINQLYDVKYHYSVIRMNTVSVRCGHPVRTKQYTKKPECKTRSGSRDIDEMILFNDSAKRLVFSAG